MEISGVGFHHELLAAGRPPGPEELSGKIMQRMDQDGDGLLSVDELGDRADRLTGADTDEDGLISQEELLTRIEAQMAEFGGLQPGEQPDIQRFKSMMGHLAHQHGLDGHENQDHVFSILDELDASEEDKKSIKEAVVNAPFDVFA